MQVGRKVGAEEAKKAGDRERFIAISQDFEVYGVSVVDKGEEGDSCVYRNHEEDSDYAISSSASGPSVGMDTVLFLLIWFEIMCGVHEHQIKGHHHGDESKDGRKEQAKPVKGDIVPERILPH